MRKIKAFIYILQNSLRSINYYKEIVQENISFSLKYFAVLALIISVATTAAIAAPIAPKINTDINNFLDNTAKSFPQDLVITLKEGKLSLNREEPYLIPLENIFTDNSDEELQFKNLIVVDPKGTVEDLNKYQTIILVNETNVITRAENGEIQSNTLQGIPDREFTQSNVAEIANSVKPITNLLIGLFIVVLFAGVLVYNFIFRLVYLVVPTLFFMIAGYFRGLKIKFAGYYQLAIHAMTLPLIVELILVLARFSFPLPFWFFTLHILFGIIVVFVMSEENKQD